MGVAKFGAEEAIKTVVVRHHLEMHSELPMPTLRDFEFHRQRAYDRHHVIYDLD